MNICLLHVQKLPFFIMSKLACKSRAAVVCGRSMSSRVRGRTESESRLCDLLGVIWIGLLHCSASASSEWWSESNELPYTYSVPVLSRAFCIVSAHNDQFSSLSLSSTVPVYIFTFTCYAGHKEHLAFLLPWQIFAFLCFCSCANLEWLLSSLLAGWNPTQISKLKSKTTAFMKPFQYPLYFVCTSFGGSSCTLIHSFSSTLSVHLNLNSLSYGLFLKHLFYIQHLTFKSISK